MINILGVNMLRQKSVEFINLIVPYTFKLLITRNAGNVYEC